MLISIRKVFSGLQNTLLVLGIGVSILAVQLFHISQYGGRLDALRNQHLLIEKSVSADLSDPSMAAIVLNTAVAELALSVKLSGEATLLDALFASQEEHDAILGSLQATSKEFQENVLAWSNAKESVREAHRAAMMEARTAYLADISRMLDYQIGVTHKAIAAANISAALVVLLGLAAFLVYRKRLNLVYDDIHHACAVDVDGSRHEPKTHELDFIVKQLARRNVQQPSAAPAPCLTHPSSGLHNDRGLFNAFNAKRAGKAGNSIFLSVFEIDQYGVLVSEYTKEDLKSIYRKLGEMISLYEQPLDVIAHTEDDRLVFVMSRPTKKAALDECEHIVKAVQDSSFLTSKGSIRITVSAGFMLKTPIKPLDESINDAVKLIAKAKENGGNRVAQLRESSGSF